jgi:hypothetical protein
MTDEYKKLLEEFFAKGGKIKKLEPVGTTSSTDILTTSKVILNRSDTAFLRMLAKADRKKKPS